MTNIEKIRAALELLRDEGWGATADEALTALAELERAAAEPVATVRGIVVEWTGEQPAVGTKLYAAPPPAPVAEMREPSDEECRKIASMWYSVNFGISIGERHGREMFNAVRAVMWPKGSES